MHRRRGLRAPALHLRTEPTLVCVHFYRSGELVSALRCRHQENIMTDMLTPLPDSSSNDSAGEKAVVGVFEDRLQAEYAVDALERAGFTHDHVGYVIRGSDVAAGGMLSSADGAK